MKNYKNNSTVKAPLVSERMKIYKNNSIVFTRTITVVIMHVRNYANNSVSLRFEPNGWLYKCLRTKLIMFAVFRRGFGFWPFLGAVCGFWVRFAVFGRSYVRFAVSGHSYMRFAVFGCGFRFLAIFRCGFAVSATPITRAAKSRDRRDRRSREASTSQGEAMAKGKSSRNGDLYLP